MRGIWLSLATVLVASAAAAADLVWLTDLDKAQAQAKTENKLVFINFTGSDWCGWCIKLKKEVFDTQEFADYAKTNLVLVEVDFPRRKSQSAELKKANAALRDKFKVEGFPTLVVLNARGQKLWEQVGYMRGGPKAWIAKLDELKRK